MVTHILKPIFYYAKIDQNNSPELLNLLFKQILKKNGPTMTTHSPNNFWVKLKFLIQAFLPPYLHPCTHLPTPTSLAQHSWLKLTPPHPLPFPRPIWLILAFWLRLWPWLSPISVHLLRNLETSLGSKGVCRSVSNDNSKNWVLDINPVGPGNKKTKANIWQFIGQ